MSYIDAWFEKEKDVVHVVERVNGVRQFKEIPAEYVFYYDDPNGRHTNMFGNPVSKYSCYSYSKFRKDLSIKKSQGSTYESDFNQVFRTLEQHYAHGETPELNICFFDIEVGFDPKRGFAKPTNPFAEVTAISLYLSHIKELICLALKPPTLTIDQAQEICNKFENTLLFTEEAELLDTFLKLIDDSDILTGWNSANFDIPYLVRRIRMVLGEQENSRFCLWGMLPKERKYTMFKKEQTTFELSGRIHLDYLDLYKKHNSQELHSYRLDYVGEIETGENKVPYEGTLDQLYKNDFEKFIAYSRQDTNLLYKIDAKNKFIELANQIAHTNTVLIPTTMGSVQLIEQAIINEAHDRGLIVPDRKKEFHESMEVVASESDDDDDESENPDMDGPVVGAYVAKPKRGLHKEIGSVDINSLYPSTIRALNMGPETLVGQLRPIETMRYINEKISNNIKKSEAWDGLFAILEYETVFSQDEDTIVTVDWEDGNVTEMSGKELYDLIFSPNSSLCITANGTIFRTDKESVIAGLLTRWYAERVEMKQKLKKAVEAGDEKMVEWWDQRQHIRKILLNSLYGALLNEACRFYDQRIGQSVTLTGRRIVRHMNAKINEIICGVYDHLGESTIYADTDSAYFSAYSTLMKTPEGRKMLQSRDEMIKYYNEVGQKTNESFCEFMMSNFNTNQERAEIIMAAREVVGSMGLFIKKKKYAIMVYDKEGKRKDKGNQPGEIKAMGLDLKRADTPKVMQQFLSDMLGELLQGVPEQDIMNMIREFRQKFRTSQGWEKGTPKKVNALTDYESRDDARNKAYAGNAGKKVNMPGHVRASINWNKLRNIHNDNYSMEIQDGQKVIVCKLKPNVYNITSIAYPIDEVHLPEWFKELPFDEETMESVIIDKKVTNLIGVLDWDLLQSKNDTAFDDLFSF